MEPEILAHYEAGIEAPRLSGHAGILERARTLDLLMRHLPPPPARILDVGGGPGAYSVWLAGRGYEMGLLDPVPLHVDQARAAAAAAGVALDAAIGDARRLPNADSSLDAVLLMGPLYHLTERSDRIAALSESRRVLQPGGVLMAVGISRYASLLDGLSRRFVDDPAFRSILERDLAEGQHRNPTERLDYFTTAFFHKPAHLAAEAEEAGLGMAAVFAIEGPAWLLADLEARAGDPAHWTILMDLLRRIEGDPELLSVSAHLMLVARR
jgi:SAM-dependent methyltransferase